TSAPPEAFGFVGSNPADLRVSGSWLPDAKDMSFVGGAVTFDAGAYVTARSGLVRVASLAGPGEARLTPDGLDVSPLAAMGDIVVRKEAGLDVGGDPAGKIVIRGGSLRVESLGMLEANGAGDRDHPGTSID